MNLCTLLQNANPLVIPLYHTRGGIARVARESFLYLLRLGSSYHMASSQIRFGEYSDRTISYRAYYDVDYVMLYFGRDDCP